MIKIFLAGLLFSMTTWAQLPPTEITTDQIKLDYLTSDGEYWVNCTAEKQENPHSWIATCDKYKFSLHLMLKQYIRMDEATFEFHFWATETEILKETHTQSTWLTVDSKSQAKKIVSYLGFVNDSSQLRIEIKLK